MPVVYVNLTKGLSHERKQRLARKIQEAVTRSVAMPPDRVNVYLNEIEHYRDGVFTGEAGPEWAEPETVG